MLLDKNSKTNVKSTPTVIQVNWGKPELLKLAKQKRIHIFAISPEWCEQLYLSSPSFGRRLWFEVDEFKKEDIQLTSLAGLFESTKKIDTGFGYKNTYLIDDKLLCYSDYLQLLESVASSFIDRGYVVKKYVYNVGEISPKIPQTAAPPGMSIQVPIISYVKTQEVESFLDVSEGKSLSGLPLDPYPYSVLKEICIE